MTYSIDFRKKVLGVKAEGKTSIAETAKRFAIGKATIIRWMHRVDAKLRREKSTSTVNMDALKKDIELYPDGYQHERAKRLGCTRGGIYHALKRLGGAIKKTLKHPKADPERRSTYCQRIKQVQEERRPIVYIDESGFSHDMPRTHGYSKKGHRCYGTHDWGAKGRTNSIGAIVGATRLTVSLFESTINSEVFTAWVQQDLIPSSPIGASS